MQNFSDSILSSGKRTEWDAADGRNTDGKWKVYSYWINSSCEAKALFRERQGVDALSRGREDRVANRGKKRRQRGLAQTRRRIVGLQEMHLDLRCLLHSQHGMLMIVRLHDTPPRMPWWCRTAWLRR